MAARAFRAAFAALALAAVLLDLAAAAVAGGVAAAASGSSVAAAAAAAVVGGAGSHGPPGFVDSAGATALVDRAAGVAGQAAEQAWTAVAKAKKIVEGNLKFLPLAKAEVAVAETAAKEAAKQDEEATTLLEETRTAAHQAAMQAAMGFMAEVKSAGATGTAGEWAARRSLAEQAEVAAARAASNAAMPYHAMLARGQRVIAEYTKKAQALAAAGSNLRAEGMTLASSAEQYQMVGQTVKANQIMVTAHSLLNQGNMMTKQAEQLTATAQEVNGALPLYQQAEEAAFQSAAQAANPPGTQESPPIY